MQVQMLSEGLGDHDFRPSIGQVDSDFLDLLVHLECQLCVVILLHLLRDCPVRQAIRQARDDGCILGARRPSERLPHELLRVCGRGSDGDRRGAEAQIGRTRARICWARGRGVAVGRCCCGFTRDCGLSARTCALAIDDACACWLTTWVAALVHAAGFDFLREACLLQHMVGGGAAIRLDFGGAGATVRYCGPFAIFYHDEAAGCRARWLQ